MLDLQAQLQVQCEGVEAQLCAVVYQWYLSHLQGADRCDPENVADRTLIESRARLQKRANDFLESPFKRITFLLCENYQNIFSDESGNHSYSILTIFLTFL